MNVFWTIGRGVARLLDVAAALLLLAVLAIILAQIVARYVIGVSMPWSEELSRLLFVWLILIAAAHTQHIKVSLVEDWLSGRARRAWQVVLHLVEAATAGFLAIMAYELSEFVRYDSFTTLPVSIRYLYLATAFGGALWSLTAIGRVLRTLSRTENTSDHQPGEYSE
jgi:TRAP-type C4-dicarboxylate transport system permease small subunit